MSANQTGRFVRAYAPGRVELLGNHTDYNDGVVLGVAIDRGLSVSGHTRADDLIDIRSTSHNALSIPLSALKPQTGELRWGNYVLGVAAELRASSVPICGFDAAVDGNLPAGSGLSSSAALEVATALFLLRLHQRELPPLELAKLCQRAEHAYAGVQSGLLDQVTSIFGQEDHAVFFDARTEAVRTVPLPSNVSLVIAQSGTERELASGKYNERREQTHAAARTLNVRALRDVSSAQLQEHPGLSPLLRRRALHITGENERVWRALELLHSGDAAGFGELMNASHDSSRVNFENSTPQLDKLVELARNIPGVLGSRLTGAGFGGATVTLCRSDVAENVAHSLRTGYGSTSGLPPDVFITRAAGGARIISEKS